VFSAYGDRLENILHGTWTTSYRTDRELGAAVVTVSPMSAKPLSPAQKNIAQKNVCDKFAGLAWLWIVSWRPNF
jgi:hypothetical protein